MSKPLNNVLGPHLASTIDEQGGVFVIGVAETHPTLPDLIGRVFVRWSVLESYLAELLAAILDQPPMVGNSLYYSSSTFKTRLDLVRSAHFNLMRHGDEWDKVRSKLTAISRLSKYRNRIAHNEIVMDGESKAYSFSIIEPATDEFTRNEPANPADIASHLKSLARIAGQLKTLLGGKSGPWLRSDIQSDTIYAWRRKREPPSDK